MGITLDLLISNSLKIFINNDFFKLLYPQPDKSQNIKHNLSEDQLIVVTFKTSMCRGIFLASINGDECGLNYSSKINVCQSRSGK